MNFAKEEPAGRPSSGPKTEGKTITMAMIAKAAGVSQGAISSLLNDRDYGIRVSSKTRERVFRVCREMGYMPNDLRAVVRMYPELGDFAFLISDDLGLSDPFVCTLTQEFIKRTPEQQLSITLYNKDKDYAANPDSLPGSLRNGVASRFITIGRPNTSLLSAIVAHECPVTHIGHDVALPGVTSVVPDYSAASRQGIEYLFKLGHKQIAILSGPFGSTDPAIIELNHGVRAGYDAIKTPIEAQNVIYGDFTFEHGVTSIDLLFERSRKPTAVFCFTDLVAAGVLNRAQERGLKIPMDLSVIGFGGIPFSSWLSPALTTVALPIDQIITETLKDLQNRITSQDTSSTRKISITSSVVERASCGAVSVPVLSSATGVA